MSLIESELEGALHPAVKAKSHSKRKLRVKAARVASGSSEVMVKVTGFGKGAAHVRTHLDYITRNGELEMENERGEVFKGKEAVRTLFQDWEKDFGDGKRHKNQRDTMKLMLSMPEHVDSESVRKSVRDFAASTFSKNHEFVFALHTDQRHPHCHLTVKCLGFDGRRLNPRKADLQEWREVFAAKLRDQGVDAEATPRRSRGVIRKPEPTVIRHIEQGDKTHNPRVSKVRAAKVKEAAEEISAEAAGAPIASKPWEEAIKARQSAVRRAWLTTAEALEQESIGAADRALAERIRAFIVAMPPLKTERAQLKEELTERFTKHAENKKSTNDDVKALLPVQQGDAKQEKAATRAGKDVGSKDLER